MDPTQAQALAEADTDVLEAAVFGGSSAPVAPTAPSDTSPTDPDPDPDPSDTPPAAPAAAEPPADAPPEAVAPEQVPPTGAPSEPADNSPAPSGEPAPAAPPAPEAQASPSGAQPPESASPQSPAPAPFAAQNLSDLERRALELRERNADLSLEGALAMARTELGLDPPESEGDPEPTLDERIEAIEGQLDEAGANDGLFTTEIANLTKEHARLLSERAATQAVQTVRQQQADDARTAEMRTEREASYQRAVASCPAALDATSPIGKSLSAVIAEAEKVNNPLLYDPQAPELFLAMANARLPEAQRVELRQAPAPQTPPSEAPPSPAAQPAPPPAVVLPVAAGARTAQPATSTIDPANIDRAINEMPTSELEAALLGEPAGPPVLLRL